MSYCPQQDLIDRFSEDEMISLTDHAGTGEINTDVLNRAISDAKGEIDGYLGGRFSLPINPVPELLVHRACDIARYCLYDDNATVHITERYKNAVKFLEGVASGKNSIGIDSAGAKPSSNNTAQMQSGGNVFNRKDTSFI